MGDTICRVDPTDQWHWQETQNVTVIIFIWIVSGGKGRKWLNMGEAFWICEFSVVLVSSIYGVLYFPYHCK